MKTEYFKISFFIYFFNYYIHFVYSYTITWNDREFLIYPERNSFVPTFTPVSSFRYWAWLRRWTSLKQKSCECLLMPIFIEIPCYHIILWLFLLFLFFFPKIASVAINVSLVSLLHPQHMPNHFNGSHTNHLINCSTSNSSFLCHF